MNDAKVASNLAGDLAAQLPELRGKLKAGAVLADVTWFRVGGPAEVLYSPADEADLSYFMANTPIDDPRHHHRARLQSARARRRHWRRGDPSWGGASATSRSRRARGSAPAPPCQT